VKPHELRVLALVADFAAWGALVGVLLWATS
jgi:hypothetical protein